MTGADNSGIPPEVPHDSADSRAYNQKPTQKLPRDGEPRGDPIWLTVFVISIGSVMLYVLIHIVWRIL